MCNCINLFIDFFSERSLMSFYVNNSLWASLISVMWQRVTRLISFDDLKGQEEIVLCQPVFKAKTAFCPFSAATPHTVVPFKDGFIRANIQQIDAISTLETGFISTGTIRTSYSLCE